MTVVLTLGGMNWGAVDRLDTALHGYAEKHTRVVVEYPQAAAITSITVGATSLDGLIRRHIKTDSVVVEAHSQGAEACSEWLATHAHRPDAPPAEGLRFILLGNPRRRLGGAGKTGWDWKPIPSTPETQYRVDDVTRRWDGWANNDNWPDTGWLSRLFAVRKLWRGRFSDPHLNYDDVDPDNPGDLRAQSGNTFYWVAA